MTRNEARALHASAALIGATGLVYGWMRYLVEPDPDSFSAVNHPWQPELQAAHIVAAPLLVFACGLIWRAHIWLRVKTGFRARRRTGLALAIMLVPMVVSGYALQVTGDETWRNLWIWTHGITSTLWILIYCVHQISPRSVVHTPTSSAVQSGA